MITQYFKNRKSCRFFSSQKISDLEIKEIIIDAMKAPTCGNMQLYSVILTREPEKLKQLASLHYNQPAAITSPLILTICADFNRFTRWCELSAADKAFNNFHSFIVALTDAVIFSQQIVTIAELKGYGTCYLGTVNYNAKEISEMLELPDLVVPVTSLAIGIPGKEGEETLRLQADSILHIEKYRKDSDKEIKKNFKAEEENPINQKFILENKKENLAQVFSEVRYPRSINEKISESFLKLLKEKDFIIDKEKAD